MTGRKPEPPGAPMMIQVLTLTDLRGAKNMCSGYVRLADGRIAHMTEILKAVEMALEISAPTVPLLATVVECAYCNRMTRLGTASCEHCNNKFT